MGFPTGGFPTHGVSAASLTQTLRGQAILSHPVLLGQLGPDITSSGYGTLIWSAGTYIGTWTAGLPIGNALVDLVAGYVAQESESLRQISVYAQTAPLFNSQINVLHKPSGGSWATVETITIPAGAGSVYQAIQCNIALSPGDLIAFELDSGAFNWWLGTAAVTISGLRVKE